MFHATRWMHRRSRTDYSLPARVVVNRRPSNAINPRDPPNLVICKFKMDYVTSRARKQRVAARKEEELCTVLETNGRSFSSLSIDYLSIKISWPMLVNKVLPSSLESQLRDGVSLCKIQFSSWSLIAFVLTSVRARDVSSFDYRTEGLQPLPLPRSHHAIRTYSAGSVQERQTEWSEK